MKRSSSNVTFIGAGVAAIFAVHAAWAQPAVTAPPSVSQPSVYHPPAYCRHYSLTGPEFIGMVKAIVDHHNLTNVPFVEKTLGTKFVTSSLPGNGTGDSGFFGGNIWQVFDAPISVILGINTTRASQSKFDNIAQMTIANASVPWIHEDFIGNCLHIPTSEFYSVFGSFDDMFDGVPAKEIVGKNQSEIFLNIGYNIRNNIVENIDIIQNPYLTQNK